MPSFFPRVRDVSISKKLYAIVGTMAVLIAVELFTLWFAITTLSSVRAFVGAEGLWSKSEKDAVISLDRYFRHHDEKDYLDFQKFLKVPLGDHKTRLELMKAEPNLDSARQGFIEGRNNPHDVDGMIRLFRRFHRIYYIHKAIEIWAKGDSIIMPLEQIGKQLHEEINSPASSEKNLEAIMAKADFINSRLSSLEDEFSFTLGEGSRWLENLILRLLFIIVLTVEVTGLSLSIAVSRSIRRGLNEINRAAKEIAGGDFTARSKVFSNDEIGQVAMAMNSMTEQLIQSNEDLESFVYRASHDLKGPLSSTRGLVLLALNENRSEELVPYLEMIKSSLDKLDNILVALHEVSIIRQGVLDPKPVNMKEVIENIFHDFVHYEGFEEIRVSIDDKMDREFCTDKILAQTIVRNIIENAVKYRRRDIANPFIHVIIYPNGDYNSITIADNGIGINKEFQEKVFDLFYRGTEISRGSGLGLYIVRNGMKKMGGKVDIFSEGENKGSVFHLHFPDKAC